LLIFKNTAAYQRRIETRTDYIIIININMHPHP
jgi:hypothetical protein